VEFTHHTVPSHRIHTLLHGACFEAVFPTHIDYGSPRVRAYTEEGNQVALEDAIDQLDEARDVALL
jgi:hypothetical protein